MPEPDFEPGPEFEHPCLPWPKRSGPPLTREEAWVLVAKNDEVQRQLREGKEFLAKGGKPISWEEMVLRARKRHEEAAE